MLTGRPPSTGLHAFVCLAIDAIAAYLDHTRMLDPSADLLERFAALRGRAGVFVTLRKCRDLRGCMGTYEPTQENIAVEIIESAVSAGFRDPRFPPLAREEFADLCISVDILRPVERILEIAELNPSRYGVIVQYGIRRGLLLPDLEDVTSVEEQVAIARQKGGIAQTEPIELYRFEVDRYH